MTLRIVLAHDASAAWVENLPELSAAFRNDAEVDAFAERAAAVNHTLGGAGTTGPVADRHGRDAVLIELNPEYADMAERRIRGDAPLFADVT